MLYEVITVISPAFGCSDAANGSPLLSTANTTYVAVGSNSSVIVFAFAYVTSPFSSVITANNSNLYAKSNPL